VNDILIAKLAEHWDDIGVRLDKANEAHNKSVATLESRVPVSAHRLRDLRAAPENTEIETIAPVERTTRVLLAVDLALVGTRGEDGVGNPPKDRS
jgi:DNA recombination protein RmuC